MLGQGVQFDRNPSNAAVGGTRRRPSGPTHSHRVAKKIRNTLLSLFLSSWFPAAPAPILSRPPHHERTITACCIAAAPSSPHCRSVLHHGSMHRTRRATILPLHHARVRPPAFIALHHASAPPRPSTACPPLLVLVLVLPSRTPSLRPLLLSPTCHARPPLLVGPLSPARVGLVVLARRRSLPAPTPRPESTGPGPLPLCCKCMF
jgi:hypothetical protein